MKGGNNQELPGSVTSRTLRVRQNIKRRATPGRERVKEIEKPWKGTGLNEQREI